MARQVIDTTTNNGSYIGDPAKVAFTKTNDNFAELYEAVGALPPDAVQLLIGFQMIYVGPSALTIGPGVAYVPGLGRRLVMASVSAKTGIVVAANTWLHAYVYESSPGVVDTEWSTTAPAPPYSGTARTKAGDPSRRYLGSARSGAANSIYRFKHVLANGSVTYDENTAVAPFLMVAAGAATTATAVSAAAVAPITAVSIHANVYNAAATSFVHISNSRGPTAGVGYICLAGPNANTATQIPLDSAGQYTYAYESPPSNASFQRMFGYTFER